MNKTRRKRRKWPIALAVTVALLITAAVLAFMALKSVFPVEYGELVRQNCERTGLPPSLVMAVIKAESSFRPGAVSGAGAYGLMQLTEDTLEWLMFKAGETSLGYTADDLLRPEINIKYGTDMLRLMREEFGEGDAALAAYNAGRGRVNEWLGDPRYSSDGESLSEIPYKETREYVKKVRDYQRIYEFLYPELVA